MLTSVETLTFDIINLTLVDENDFLFIFAIKTFLDKLPYAGDDDKESCKYHADGQNDFQRFALHFQL